MAKRSWAAKEVRKVPLVRRALLAHAKKEHKRVFATAPVSMEDLLSRRIYFHTEKPRKTAPDPQSSFSFFREFPLHDRFLHKYRFRIKSFADVGCDLPGGAPATEASQKVLRPGTLVHAVDVFPMPSYFGKMRFVPLVHNISKAPLPFANFAGKIVPKGGVPTRRYDAIRFAHVASHMSKGEVRDSLRNLHASLNEGGFLLGAAGNHEFILRKKGNGFALVTGF